MQRDVEYSQVYYILVMERGRGGGMEWCIEKTKLQRGVAST